MIIPKHVFDPFRGAKSREAPANLKPVGTGAYRFVDFKPGDIVRGEANPAYHVPNRPFFDALEMKGGGDAVSAARAVLQTGEYDYAWNMQVEDDILRRIEQGGKGRVNIWPTGNPEHIQCNFTDPWTEVDGERSSVKTTHPLLSDPAVRQALNLLVDRAAVQEQIYGRGGQTSANFLNAPSRFRSKNTRWEFNVDKANQVLDAAGWKRGADGIRAKDGKRLKFLYQTSINAPRQKNQAIVKQAAAKAGIEIEIKSVVASVFFSSDPANPDTYPHFYADLQMYNTTMTAPDPQYFMNQFCSWEVLPEGQQVAGPQHHPVAQRRVRPHLQGRGQRARPGQAGRALHQDERHRDPERGGDPGAVAQRGLRLGQRAAGHGPHRLGLDLLAAALLVQAGIAGTVRRT